MPWASPMEMAVVANAAIIRVSDGRSVRELKDTIIPTNATNATTVNMMLMNILVRRWPDGMSVKGKCLLCLLDAAMFFRYPVSTSDL